MTDMRRITTEWEPRLLAALRIIAALLFLEHGLVKLIGFPAGAVPGLQPVLSLDGIGAVIEALGGVLVAIGLFTRVAAFIMAGEMAVAYFMFHAPVSFYPAVNAGDAAILFCFVFLYLSAAGPGSWSLDQMRNRARP